MYRIMYRLIPVLFLAGISPARADPGQDLYPAMALIGQYQYANQADEIVLARSAAPASISDKAQILVLGAHGYETAVPGSNGFVCFVGRSWEQDFDTPEFWNPKIRTPQCWNAAAVSSVLPDYLERTQWVLAGVSKEQMWTRTKAALAAGEIDSPAPESMVYMMSKNQYIKDPPVGHWYPHVMFFVPTTEAGKWGANLPGAPIFAATSDVEPITTLMVVVPKWSDGRVAIPPPTRGHRLMRVFNPRTHTD